MLHVISHKCFLLSQLHSHSCCTHVLASRVLPGCAAPAIHPTVSITTHSNWRTLEQSLQTQLPHILQCRMWQKIPNSSSQHLQFAVSCHPKGKLGIKLRAVHELTGAYRTVYGCAVSQTPAGPPVHQSAALPPSAATHHCNGQRQFARQAHLGHPPQHLSRAATLGYRTDRTISRSTDSTISCVM